MTFKVILPAIFLLCFSFQFAFAQQENDVIVENILETLAENQEENTDYSEFVEILNHYRRHPIHLNQTNREQLSELRFLNPLQINNFLTHIAVNGKLIDTLELQSIKGFDLETIKKLLFFADIQPPTGFEDFSFKDLAKNGKSDLIIRYGRVLQNQVGYLVPKDSGKSHYTGSPDRMFLRYRFNYNNRLQFSLNADKDAGEPYWNTNRHSYGPDFLSASLYLKNLHAFKKIVAGDYALQFGQGITLWSGLGFGKGADIFSIAKQDLGLKPYTSVNEYSFLRGIATQIKFGKFDFTPFFSYRRLDASTDFNTASNTEEVGAISISGLHRTTNELENKSNVQQTIFGGNLQYNFKTFNIGFTSYRSIYDKKFAAGDKLYNQFEFAGKSLTNLGVHYSLSLGNTYFFGELAHSLDAGWAMINGAITSLNPNLSALVFHRNYQKNYHSFFNQGISENTNAVNEKGLFGGLKYTSGKKYQFSFYADLFKFPWLKFGTDAPSQGMEIFSQFNYSPTKTTQLILRYKIEEKQSNAPLTGPTASPEINRKQNYRAEIQYQLSNTIQFRNRTEMVQFKTESDKNQFGFLAYQDIIYHPLNSKFTANLRFALFDTEGYDTRIYAYENDVLYGFSIPGFQNTGTRIYFNGRYNLKKGIDIWCKYSLTKYQDTETIGSGLEEIEGDLRSEIRLQFRYQF